MSYEILARLRLCVPARRLYVFGSRALAPMRTANVGRNSNTKNSSPPMSDVAIDDGSPPRAASMSAVSRNMYPSQLTPKNSTSHTRHIKNQTPESLPRNRACRGTLNSCHTGPNTIPATNAQKSTVTTSPTTCSISQLYRTCAAKIRPVAPLLQTGGDPWPQ